MFIYRGVLIKAIQKSIMKLLSVNSGNSLIGTGTLTYIADQWSRANKLWNPQYDDEYQIILWSTVKAALSRNTNHKSAVFVHAGLICLLCDLTTTIFVRLAPASKMDFAVVKACFTFSSAIFLEGRAGLSPIARPPLATHLEETLHLHCRGNLKLHCYSRLARCHLRIRDDFCITFSQHRRA